MQQFDYHFPEHCPTRAAIHHRGHARVPGLNRVKARKAAKGDNIETVTGQEMLKELQRVEDVR